MGILKRKGERTATVTVRVPRSVRAELDRLRDETAQAGFDLNGTLSETVARVTRQIREELGQATQVTKVGEGPSSANGIDGSAAATKKLVS
jgi:hypothetical protein